MDNTRNRARRRFKNRINKSRDQKHDASLYDYPAVLTRNACNGEESL